MTYYTQWKTALKMSKIYTAIVIIITAVVCAENNLNFFNSFDYFPVAVPVCSM